MFCPYCGNEIKNGVTFCGKCGSEIRTPGKERIFTASVKPKSSGAQPLLSDLSPSAVSGLSDIKNAKSNKSTTRKENRKTVAITKNDVITFVISAAFPVIYVGIIILLLSLINISDSISVKTNYDNGFIANLTLKEFLDILISGNRAFYPTALSLCFGIGVYVFVYGAAVFAVLGLLHTLFSKKSIALHICSSLLSMLASVFVILIAPLSIRFVNGFKQALAINTGVILDEISSVSCIKLIIFTVLVFVLVILSTVLAFVIKKRRGKR